MAAFVSHKHSEDSSLYTFRVSKGFELPSRISRCSQEQFELVLKIANQILAYKESLCNEEFSQTIMNEITKDYEQKIKEIEKNFKKDSTRHQQETTSVINRLESSLIEQEKHFRKEIAELEVALHRATATQDLVRKQFEEEADRRVAQQKENDFVHIEYIENLNKQMRDEIKSLYEERSSRQAILSNSNKKGKEGEVQFEALVLDRKGWHLNYTGNKGHSADYSVTLHNVNIRFEVKNYTTTVPVKEVEKLRRDMREHPETDVGVFISFNTNIQSVQTVSIEWTNTNQLIIFVPVFMQQDIDLMLHFLDLVFQTVKPYRAILSDTTKNNQYPILKERIERTLQYAQNGLLRITQTVNQFSVDIRAVQDRLDDMISHTKTNLSAQKEEIHSIISILTGKEHDIEIDDEAPAELPVIHEEKQKRNKKKKTTA